MRDTVARTVRRHLSSAASAVTFLLLSHSNHLPDWVRLACGLVVVGMIAYMHVQVRKAARLES